MKILITEKQFKRINESLSVNKKPGKLIFMDSGNEIGYIEYDYNGGSFSEHLDPNEKEFHLSMIEIKKEYRGINNYASKMLDYIKNFAKKLGATIITLRVDYGMGYGGTRNPNDKLDRLYLKNDFIYSFTEEECLMDDTKNLGAMHYKF